MAKDRRYLPYIESVVFWKLSRSRNYLPDIEETLKLKNIHPNTDTNNI